MWHFLHSFAWESSSSAKKIHTMPMCSMAKYLGKDEKKSRSRGATSPQLSNLFVKKL